MALVTSTNSVTVNFTSTQETWERTQFYGRSTALRGSKLLHGKSHLREGQLFLGNTPAVIAYELFSDVEAI